MKCGINENSQTEGCNFTSNYSIMALNDGSVTENTTRRGRPRIFQKRNDKPTMKISFSTLACPDYSWTDIYSMAKDLHFDGIEVRGLGDDIIAVKERPFTDIQLPLTVKKIKETSHETLAEIVGESKAKLITDFFDAKKEQEY